MHAWTASPSIWPDSDGSRAAGSADRLGRKHQNGRVQHERGSFMLGQRRVERPPCSSASLFDAGLVCSLLTTRHEATMRTSLVALAVGLATCWTNSTAHAQTGPSFPCPKPDNPLAQLICSSPDLSQIDLWYVQAYLALRACCAAH